MTRKRAPPRPTAQWDARGRQGLSWLLFAHLLLSPLVFSRSTLEAFEYPKVSLLLATAIVLGTAGLVSLVRTRGAATMLWVAWVRRTPLAAGMVLLVASATLATAFSISPRTSWRGGHETYGGLLTVLALATLFFGTRAVCRNGNDFRRLMAAPALAAVLTTAYALAQVAGLDPITWRQTAEFGGVQRAASTMGHPNLLAAFLAMAVPLLWEQGRHARRRGQSARAAAWALAVVAAAVVVVATLSRAGWLALGAAVAILVAAEPAGHRGERFRAPLAAGVALAIAAVVALLAVAGTGTGRAVAERIRSAPEAGLGPRVYLWAAALRMFGDHPIAGVGLDCFALGYQGHRSLQFWRREGPNTPAKAHCAPLDVLATQGLVGGVALLVIAAGALAAAARALRSGAKTDLVVPAVAALTAFAAQDLLNFTVAATGSLAVTLLAVLSRAGEGSVEAAAEPAVLPPGAVLLGIAIAAAGEWVLVVDPFRANVLAAGGAKLVTGRPSAAYERLRQAVALDPGAAVFWAHLGAAAEARARQAPPAHRPVFYEEARKALLQARDLVPVDATRHAALGRLLTEMSLQQPPLATRKEATDMFAAALARDPLNPVLHAEAARSALRFDELDRVRALAARGRELDADYGPFTWALGSAELAEGVRARAAESEQASARLEAAVQLLARAVDQRWYGDEHGRGLAAGHLAVALITIGRTAEARAAAERALRLAPNVDSIRYNLAQICERLGDREAARAEYRSILRSNPGHGLARAALEALEGNRPH